MGPAELIFTIPFLNFFFTISVWVHEQAIIATL